VGVFLTYASRRGYAFIDRALYLPESWAQDVQRRRQAHMPDTVAFHTKPQIGQMMLERALTAGVPFAWVAADSVYGSTGRLRRRIAEAGRSYVLGVLSSQQWGRRTADESADALPATAWDQISCGAGAKGPRLYEWAHLTAIPIEGFVHGLLIRRHPRRHGERAYFLTRAPSGTPLAKLIEIAGRRWTIESGFEQAKGEVGLDQYEVRRYDAWYRHITLALFAHAYLAAVRARSAGKKCRPGTVARALAAHRPRSTPAVSGPGPHEKALTDRHSGLVALATSSSTACQTVSLDHPDQTST
jgi:SRSO17 transposase